MADGPLSAALARVAAHMNDPGVQQQALQLIGSAWAEASNEMAPVGQLREGEQPEGYQPLKGNITFAVESPTHGALVLPAQAAYVLFGTAPHIIRPLASRTGRGGRATALRFSVGKTPFFARVVHHPGTKKDDFAARAWHSSHVAAARAQIPAIFTMRK